MWLTKGLKHNSPWTQHDSSTWLIVCLFMQWPHWHLIISPITHTPLCISAKYYTVFFLAGIDCVLKYNKANVCEPVKCPRWAWKMFLTWWVFSDVCFAVYSRPDGAPSIDPPPLVVWFLCCYAIFFVFRTLCYASYSDKVCFEKKRKVPY